METNPLWQLSIGLNLELFGSLCDLTLSNLFFRIEFVLINMLLDVCDCMLSCWKIKTNVTTTTMEKFIKLWTILYLYVNVRDIDLVQNKFTVD